MAATEDSIYSSYREMMLEHLFTSALMKHLWLTYGARLEILRSQVDASGFDLVLEANEVVRHVQLKASHQRSATGRILVNTALAAKPSGCVVWMIFDRESLDFVEFRWLGGVPGQQLRIADDYAIATATRRNAEGVKPSRPNIRVVPKSRFQTVSNIEGLVLLLFGKIPPRPGDLDDGGAKLRDDAE